MSLEYLSLTTPPRPFYCACVPIHRRPLFPSLSLPLNFFDLSCPVCTLECEGLGYEPALERSLQQKKVKKPFRSTRAMAIPARSAVSALAGEAMTPLFQTGFANPV